MGGDKPLTYLPIPKEDNPFLGERGIRVGLDRPEILRVQLRAILRAAVFGNVSVMFPMIATLNELRDVKAMLAEEAASLGVPPVAAGIMVEVPATAIMAAQFAREADFFSIGTNDLTQYTLAMDRGHPKLAPRVDGLSPAVLRLIAQTVKGAHAMGRRVGVCGGIASDRSAVPILLGLGVDELSVCLPAIPAMKAQIRAPSHRRLPPTRRARARDGVCSGRSRARPRSRRPTDISQHGVLTICSRSTTPSPVFRRSANA